MKFFILTLALVLVAFPMIAQASDYKTPTCSLATIKGSFGGAAEGWIMTPNGPVPFVSVGLPTYDGAGKFTIRSASSVGGVISPFGTPTSGTYSVTHDCSFSASLTAPDGKTTITWAGTITGRGMTQEIHLMYTNAYWVISGTQRRIPVGGCSQGTLKGTYALFGHGFVSLPNLPPLLPANHIGIFAADGWGTFSGDETVSVAGQLMFNTYTATYKVEPDCSFSTEITNGDNEVFHEVGTLTGVGQAQEGHLIIVEPGWVFAETGKMQ